MVKPGPKPSKLPRVGAFNHLPQRSHYLRAQLGYFGGLKDLWKTELPYPKKSRILQVLSSSEGNDFWRFSLVTTTPYPHYQGYIISTCSYNFSLNSGVSQTPNEKEFRRQLQDKLLASCVLILNLKSPCNTPVPVPPWYFRVDENLTLIPIPSRPKTGLVNVH